MTRPAPPGDPQAYLAAIGRLLDDDRDVALFLNRFDLWCLTAMVQLACHHPANRGPTRARAEYLVRTWRAFFADDPHLVTLWEISWSPAEDAPADGGAP